MCVFCDAFMTTESIYYLDITMWNVYFISAAPFVDSRPLQALPFLFLCFAELLTTVLQS